VGSEALVIGGVAVQPGTRKQVNVPLPGLYTDTSLTMPVHVLRGRRDGPTVFVSAAVHGDEILGVEIIRRLLLQPRLKSLRGSLIAVPIVNVPGFHIRSRYLPDRRDLNRSFPGREQGSMASRLAHVFLAEIVRNADVGIDLHTAAVHRENFPQVRADMNLEGLAPLAKAFAAPVLIHSAPPENSLRRTAAAEGVPILVYEAGEALRFDEIAIRIGLRGVINVLRKLDMLSVSYRSDKRSAVVRSSTWVRAPNSGICRAVVKLGSLVSTDEVLAYLGDAGRHADVPVCSPCDGLIIGRATLPLAFEGEALFHVGRTLARQRSLLEEHVDAMQDSDEFSLPELVEEPEIV
jgi:predicted deacylase